MNDPDLIDEMLRDFPELGSTQEVADVMRVRIVTVNKWIRNGHLKAIRAGRRVQRVPKAQLREFLLSADSMDENRVNTAGQTEEEGGSP